MLYLICIQLIHMYVGFFISEISLNLKITQSEILKGLNFIHYSLSILFFFQSKEMDIYIILKCPSKVRNKTKTCPAWKESVHLAPR